jgi:hypothetical protein
MAKATSAGRSPSDGPQSIPVGHKFLHRGKNQFLLLPENEQHAERLIDLLMHHGWDVKRAQPDASPSGIGLWVSQPSIETLLAANGYVLAPPLPPE